MNAGVAPIPPPGEEREAGPKNRAARRSLICGIFAVLCAPTQFLTFIAIGLGIAGAVFGVMGLRASSQGAPGRGMAIAGLILSVVINGGLVGWVIAVCSRGC